MRGGGGGGGGGAEYEASFFRVSASHEFFLFQGRETYGVKLQHSGEVFDIDEDDIEKVSHVKTA